MHSEHLIRTRNLLTVGLLLNTIAWFIPDMFFPDSHFRSSVWLLHSRIHVGAAATINMVYIVYGLYLIWRPRFDLRQTMRWVAEWLALWNATFFAFALLVVPFMLQPGDTFIHFSFEAAGAGNDAGTGIEAAVFPMAGIPLLIFAWVIYRLRK